MRLIFLLLVSLALSTVQAQTSETPHWLSDFLNDKEVSNSPISICALDMETGEILLDQNSKLCLPPASTLKLVTTATALKILGNDFKFQTSLQYSGEIKDSTLTGDLIIVGGGDPTLGSKYMFGENRYDFYKIWTEAVKELGINKIHGNILIDASYFEDEDVPQTWIWEDLGNYFGAAAQSISLYDNTFNLVFETEGVKGGNTMVLGTEPFIPGLTLENLVVASDDPRDRAFVYGSPFASHRIIKGTLPKGRDEFRVKASIPDPGILLGFEFQKALLTNGIEITGDVTKSQSENWITDSTFFVWESPALSEIITPLNYESINLFAEHLCKQLGKSIAGEGSTKAGCRVIKQYWKEQNYDTGFLFLADGSGLSRANGVSSHFLVKILNEMYNDTVHSEAFSNSIPVTGLQGTQKYYFQQSILKGKAQAKSGSMTRVRSFAGYMETTSGRKVAFAMIANNFNCGSFKMAGKLEKLMEEMYLNL